MAFIRWKKNKFGLRQAYLVHAYRDADGKPKQKTLAYLGPDADLSADRLSQIKERHRHLPIQWERIRPTARPPLVNVSLLSDAEMMKRLHELRQERGMTKKGMVEALLAAGVSCGSKSFRRGKILNLTAYRHLEEMYTTGREFYFYDKPEQEFIPYVRKVLEGYA